MQGTLIDTVADRLFGFAAGNLIAAFTIVSMSASISAMILAGLVAAGRFALDHRAVLKSLADRQVALADSERKLSVAIAEDSRSDSSCSRAKFASA